MKKCIISIDVGVKNLAICALTESMEKEVAVIFWKWYNVTQDEPDEAVTALAPVKVKRVKKIVDPDAPPPAVLGICQNTVKKTGKPCGKKGPVNVRGRAYCGVHNPVRKHTPHDTQEWCFSMLSKLPIIGADLEKVLPKDRSLIEVLIEQQSMDNKKILLQSHLIFGYFVQHFANVVSVRFVPAYNKLLVYDGPAVACELKTPYAKRKFLARKHTAYFIEKLKSMGKWKEFFDNCKSKQDDISDAFLQGLYCIKGPATPIFTANEGGGDKAPYRRRRRKVKF